MPRLKITGYIDTDELDSALVDVDHPTGLTEAGYLQLVHGDGDGPALSLTALDDVDTEIVQDQD